MKAETVKVSLYLKNKLPKCLTSICLISERPK